MMQTRTCFVSVSLISVTLWIGQSTSKRLHEQVNDLCFLQYTLYSVTVMVNNPNNNSNHLQSLVFPWLLSAVQVLLWWSLCLSENAERVTKGFEDVTTVYSEVMVGTHFLLLLSLTGLISSLDLSHFLTN